MIWIQISDGQGKPTTTFVGERAVVRVEVRTDPPVAGISVDGQVLSPANKRIPEFGWSGTNATSFVLDAGRHKVGRYRVTATVRKQGYRDTTLTTDFYYRFREPQAAAPGPDLVL